MVLQLISQTKRLTKTVNGLLACARFRWIEFLLPAMLKYLKRFLWLLWFIQQEFGCSEVVARF